MIDLDKHFDPNYTNKEFINRVNRPYSLDIPLGEFPAEEGVITSYCHQRHSYVKLNQVVLRLNFSILDYLVRDVENPNSRFNRLGLSIKLVLSNDEKFDIRCENRGYSTKNYPVSGSEVYDASKETLLTRIGKSELFELIEELYNWNSGARHYGCIHTRRKLGTSLLGNLTMNNFLLKNDVRSLRNYDARSISLYPVINKEHGKFLTEEESLINSLPAELHCMDITKVTNYPNFYRKSPSKIVVAKVRATKLSHHDGLLGDVCQECGFTIGSGTSRDRHDRIFWNALETILDNCPVEHGLVTKEMQDVWLDLLGFLSLMKQRSLAGSTYNV